MKEPYLGVPVANPHLIAKLRADLQAANFTVNRVTALLGPTAAAALHREEITPARMVLDRLPATPLRTLTGLFTLGAAATVTEVDDALPTLGASGAQQLGLVAAIADDDAQPARICARVDLRPYAQQGGPAGDEQWWVASDLSELVTGEVLHPEHVLGIGGASATLAGYTIREHKSRVLDLGTGCAVQALHALSHSDHIIATDLSERALAFAQFNVLLAGAADRVELRQGSMLEPVAGELFDLVVSNPPFVISPPTDGPRYTYRDGGQRGDTLISQLVRDVGAVLAPGGIAQFLGNWEIGPRQDWKQVVGQWLGAAETAGHHLDAWIVQREMLDPAQYVETWLRDGGSSPERDRRDWNTKYRHWLTDFQQREVDAIGLGVIVLRRAESARQPLRRFEELTQPLGEGMGAQIAADLAAHDFITNHPDAELLSVHFDVPSSVTQERHYLPGNADPSVIQLRQGGGWRRTAVLDSLLAGFVGACDGELSAGQIMSGLCAILELDAQAVQEQLLPQIADLVREGFLIPVAD